MQGRLFGRITLLFAICVAPLRILGQDKAGDLQSLYAELDSIFSEDDIPADLFVLADSLLALDKARASALSARIGYVSSVVSAGRTLGFDQHGFSPGITYFHHSGITAGVTGYFSSESDPAYYLTDANIGYALTKQKFNFQLNHDFYIYHDTLADNHLFDKSIQGSVAYNEKYFTVGGDYALLYGNSESHRVTAQINGNFKIRLEGFIDAITFMPGAAFQWGNADIYYWRQPRTAASDLYWIVRNNDYPRLSAKEYLRLTWFLENDFTNAAAFFLRQREYSQDEVDALFEQYYDGSLLSENAFGFMNLSFSLPVIIRSGNFSLLLNYTYNQPQRLPGETSAYDPNGYFSTSLSYTVTWIKK